MSGKVTFVGAGPGAADLLTFRAAAAIAAADVVIWAASLVHEDVLAHARDCFPGVKLHAVLGGLHLSGINERIIPQTVSALGDFGLDVIAAGHCTGWRAMTALANAFGDGKLVPLAVGKRMRF